MILGIGTDLVFIPRIADILSRHDARFIGRVFAPCEEYAGLGGDLKMRAAHYAKRWAAKEATAKALGIGIDHGVYLKDIRIMRAPNRAPYLVLKEGAQERAHLLNGGKMPVLHLSLSDDGDYASAFVVIEGL